MVNRPGWAGFPVPGLSRRAARRGLARARDRVSPAVVALTLYTWVLIARVAELLPSLRLVLVLAFVSLVLALTLPRANSPGILQSPEVKAVFALFGLAAFLIPFSVWPGGSFDLLINDYAKTIVFFLLLVHCVRSVRDLQWLIGGLLAAILTLEIWVLFFSVGDRAKATGTYDPNDISFVMVCAIPLAITFFLYRRGVSNLLAGAIGLLGVATIIQTLSRAGFLSLIAIGGIMMLRVPSRRPALKFALVIGAVSAFVFFASDAYWGRIATIWHRPPGNSASDYDAAGLKGARLEIWTAGLRMIADNPLSGVGFGSFQLAEGTRRGRTLGHWTVGHNSFIHIAAELGLGGLALLIYLIYRGIANARLVARRAHRDLHLRPLRWIGYGLEIGLYGYIFAGFNLSQQYSHMLYLLVALSVVARRLATRSTGFAPAGEPADRPAARGAAPPRAGATIQPREVQGVWWAPGTVAPRAGHDQAGAHVSELRSFRPRATP